MISVSYLKSIYNRSKTIKKIDESNASMIHVDLMDGIYAGKKNFKIKKVLKELNNCQKPLDIHLMIKEPLLYIKELAKLNPFLISVHLDIDDLQDVLKEIKSYNIKCGIVINPTDDIRLIDNYLNSIDYVLIMSVYPGEGGQTFIEESIKKVEYLQDKNVLIGIDGGINEDSIKYLKNLHIDNIVCGSFICMSEDFNKQIEKLKID